MFLFFFGGEQDIPHEARHGDERVDGSKRDGDTEEASAANDALGESDVARLETHNGTGTRRLAEVDGVARVRGESGVVHGKAERIEVPRENLARSLLLVHAKWQRLESTEEEEAVEGSEGSAHGVGEP